MGDAGSIPLGFLAAALWSARLARRALAAVVPGAGVLAVHRRRERHARAPAAARRARLAGTPRALLPAPGAAGLGPSPHGARRVRADGCLRRLALWALGQPPACSGPLVGAASRVSSCCRAGRRAMAAAFARQARADDRALQLARIRRLPARRRRSRGRVGARILLRFNLELYRRTSAHDVEPRPGSSQCRPASSLAAACTAGMWRYASLPDLQRIWSRRCSAALAIAVVLVLLQRPDRAAFGARCSIRCCSR